MSKQLLEVGTKMVSKAAGIEVEITDAKTFAENGGEYWRYAVKWPDAESVSWKTYEQILNNFAIAIE